MRSNIEKILSIETVDDNRRKSSQPHKRWVDALLSSALSYRDIGATVVVVDPNGTRYTCAESFLRRATSILKDNILSDEDGERVVQLKTRTLHGEIEDFAGNWEEMKLSIFVASPLGHSGFSLLISERERGTEPFYKRLFEQWESNFSRHLSANRPDSSGEVIKAATALVKVLGKPPLEEDYEDSAESAIFA